MGDDECSNTFSQRNLLGDDYGLVITVTNAVIMLFTLTANTIIIVGLIKTKQLDSKVNRMFLGLSVSDVCIAAIVQPMVAILFSVRIQSRNCQLELATQFFSLLFGHSSAFLIVAIAVERLIHIKELSVPRDRNNVSYGRTHAIIAICFLLAIIVAVAVTISSIYGKYLIASIILRLVDFTALILIYTAYIEIYRAVSRHVRTTQVLRSENAAPSYAGSMLKALMLIVFFLFVCYMPYLSMGLVVMNDVVAYGKETTNPVNIFLIYFTYEFVYLNSFFNAVIVMHKNKSLLNYVINTLRQYTRRSAKKEDSVVNEQPIRLDDIRANVVTAHN